MKEYQKTAKDMLEFIEKSPTCFHAVENVRRMLADAGFNELSEAEEWNLEPGKGYWTVRNGSAVIAFRLPEREA